MDKVPNLAIIDCQTTGISGDKFLGALVDLGADIDSIKQGISIIPSYLKDVSSIELSPKTDFIKSFKATKIDIKFEEKKTPRSGIELIDVTKKCLIDLKISEKASDYALSIIKNLVNMEAIFHNSTPEKVHLHEAGSVDTIIDTIGSAIALDDLNLFNNVTWLGLPVAVGCGSMKFSHGHVSVPAPATLEILTRNNIEITGGAINEELTTPTGAAIMAGLKMTSISNLPVMKIKSIGYGVGTKIFPGIPNTIRIIIGYQKENIVSTDEVIVLETNLDDVTGEILGYAIKKLITEGNARDVCIIPTITKKNRPGQLIKVITDNENQENVVKILINETGTLGVRSYPSKRYILEREIKTLDVEIDKKNWKINVKIIKNRDGKIIRIKPEFNDILHIAKNSSLPARLIEEIAIKAIYDQIYKK